MDELMNRVGSAIPAKWKSFGRQLKLTESLLDTIYVDQFGKAQECFSAVFSTWSRLLPSPYTWETVVRVLKSPELNEVSIATSIEKWLEEQVAITMQDQSIGEDVRVIFLPVYVQHS